MVGFGQQPGGPVRGGGGGAAPAPPGVLTATLRELAARNGGGPPVQPVRLDRHLLMLFTGGHGTHTVDFVPHTCRAGTLIWARPGQVIQYGRQPGLDAILVQWEQELLAGLGVRAGAGHAPAAGAAWWQLAGEDEDAIINEVSQLVVDCQRHATGTLPAELLGHQLAVLVLRVAMLPTADTPAATDPDAGVFGRLLREIEHGFTRSRRVEEYAARLSCSVRTLTRACLAATGRSAKQVIDDRVALEARRLLACTNLPVAEVGQRLGFTEPTNFGRFFQREVGRSPGAFRANLHTDRPEDPHADPHECPPHEEPQHEGSQHEGSQQEGSQHEVLQHSRPQHEGPHKGPHEGVAPIPALPRPRAAEEERTGAYGA